MTENADLAALIRTIPDYPKPGILFRDVSTLLLDGAGFRTTIDRLAALVAPDTRLIAGIEARGFIVAAGLSYALGLGKLMLRKPGKLPGEKIGIDYQLEYGSDRIELHTGQVLPGQKILLVDDLIATGGTALAGGSGSILGSVLGALIMQSIDSGMLLLDVSIGVRYVIIGQVLIAAVVFDVVYRRMTGDTV
jgi:adenine phosphoribosyltransferase